MLFRIYTIMEIYNPEFVRQTWKGFCDLFSFGFSFPSERLPTCLLYALVQNKRQISSKKSHWKGGSTASSAWSQFAHSTRNPQQVVNGVSRLLGSVCHSDNLRSTFPSFLLFFFPSFSFLFFFLDLIL